MASASEDELAQLPGAKLVAYLSNTYHRADFEAVARILHARDLRNATIEAELVAALADLDAATVRGSGDAEVTAELEATLAEIEAVQEKYKALLDAFLGPQYEVEEMAPMARATAPDPARQEEPRVEEAKEAEVKDIDIIDLSSDAEEEERAAGGCEEEDDDDEDTESLSQRVKRRRVHPGELETGKGDVRGLSAYCNAGIGGKERLSDGLPARGISQPWKGIAKINKTPLVESSAKYGNKEVGAEKCASLPRLSVEPKITLDVVPFEPCNKNNTCVQVKREMSLLPSTVTTNWVSEAEVFNAMFNDNNGDLTMQALCALYRQGKLAIEDKRKEFRAKKLAGFLLDDDLHGPVKRTAEELKKKDVTNALFLREVTTAFSEQLFGIFMNKEDPYFC